MVLFAYSGRESWVPVFLMIRIIYSPEAGIDTGPRTPEVMNGTDI